jgi:DegV family protein with EDD domain
MLQEEDPGKQIAVIDSKATGPEEAMLIWKARNLILEGREFDAIERELNETAEKIHTSFALASYHNLIKNGRVSRLKGFIAGHLGFWGIGIGNEQGEIAMRGRARGSRSMIRFLTEELQKVGLAGKQIVISHCMNEKDARDLRSALLAVFPDVKVLVQPTRGLDSFYAERGGLIVGY